jgi:hypothetical protein
MIQFVPVRATACALVLCSTALIAERSGRAAETQLVAMYWQPPGHPALGDAVRTAFVDIANTIGARVVDATSPPIQGPALAPALDAAKAAYARFAFPEAIAALDELERLANASGGADLDGRALSEIFLYRGLAKLETAATAAAWEDLVRAARLDPTRVVDPTQFPPRAVGVYKRAVAEVVDLPRAELTLDVPAGATVRVDGTPSTATTTVTLGSHFVSVLADGHEPWLAVVSVSSTRTHIAPPLRLYQPPQADKLLGLLGGGDPRRVLLGALERTSSGWRFTVRDIALPEGRLVSDSVALGDVPTRAAVQTLVRRLVPSTPQKQKRWLPWAIAGGAALLIATSLVAASARDDTSPNVVGNLGAWR